MDFCVVQLQTSAVEIQPANGARDFRKTGALAKQEERGRILMLEQAVSTKEKKNVFGFGVRCVYSFFRESLCRVSCSVIAGSKYSWAATHRQSRGALPRHPKPLGFSTSPLL